MRDPGQKRWCDEISLAPQKKVKEGVTVPGYFSDKEGQELRVRADASGPAGTQTGC